MVAGDLIIPYSHACWKLLYGKVINYLVTPKHGCSSLPSCSWSSGSELPPLTSLKEDNFAQHHLSPHLSVSGGRQYLSVVTATDITQPSWWSLF